MIGAINSALYMRLARRINESTRSVAESTERIASGQKYLRPEPGVSGFINRLDSQMRGMSAASENVERAFGYVELAGARLDRLSDITQEIRSLAVEASDDGVSLNDRALIEEQAQSLLDEFDNLVNNTSLDGRSLLNGAFGEVSLQVGANAGNELSFSFGDARSSTLGGVARRGTVNRVNTGAAITGFSSSLQLNGVTIGASEDDGISTVGGDYSARAIATAINKSSSQTGVSAEAGETAVSVTFTNEDFDAEFGGPVTFAGSEFQINNVNIEGSFSNLTEFQSAINAESSSTGVTVNFTDTDQLTFTAEDGRNINISLAADPLNERNVIIDDTFANRKTFQTNDFSLGGSVIVAGAVELYSSEAFTVSGKGASSAIGGKTGTVNITSGTQFLNFDLSSVENAEEAIQILDVTIDEISTLQADVSSIHSRLSRTASSLIEGAGILDDTKKALTQTDQALEISSLAVAQLLQDSSIASLTQANISAATTARLLNDLTSIDFFDD